MPTIAPAILRWRVRRSSAVLILVTAILLIGATAAALLRRTDLFRLTGLIRTPAFLALLARLGPATLLILADLILAGVLALLLVAWVLLRLLLAIRFIAQLLLAILLIARIVAIVRHIKISSDDAVTFRMGRKFIHIDAAPYIVPINAVLSAGVAYGHYVF